MIKHKWIGAITALLMAAAVLATSYAYLNPSALAALSGATSPAYTSAMDKAAILDIQIIVDDTQWAAMLDTATSEEYIPATVVINGNKIANVGIRPKGNSSLSTVAQDSTTDRYSFKIEFDHYVTGQTWLGLDKLAVNNMQSDASYMKEYLSYDIMHYVGVDAPLYAFADISVNGETWGFYLAVECLEDSYARRVYGNDHGALYKPESMGMRGQGRMNEFIEQMQTMGDMELPDMQGQLEPPQMPEGGGMGGMGDIMASNGISLQYTDDTIASYSAIFDNAVFQSTDQDYRRVIKALKSLSAGEGLSDIVDVEAVLKYFAAHTVVVNLDSYVSNMAHNYYLYEDNGQLTILPWDYNLSFGGFQSASASSVVNFPIDTPVSGVSLEDRPLLGKLLEVPEYLELYHGYLAQIVDGYFGSGLFGQTMDGMTALISPYVEQDPSAFYPYEEYQQAIVTLKELCLLRAESIRGQLDGTIPSTTEGQNANPDSLIDASSINLSTLGSQGMGGGMGAGAGRGQGGFDRNATEQPQGGAQQLPEGAEWPQDGTQQPPQGMERPQRGTEWAQGEMGDRGNQSAGARAQTDEATAGRGLALGAQSSMITAGFDMGTWVLLGVCTILLLAGLLVVTRFKRRAA